MSKTLEIFFTGKFFKIPSYQRDYAWDESNIDDLLEDIIESIETETKHYIGTFILSKTKYPNHFNVVDGQQRLTAIIMLLNIAVKKLASRKEKIIYIHNFIKSDDEWKLELHGENGVFFEKLLSGKKQSPKTISQKLLSRTHEIIGNWVDAIKKDRKTSTKFLEYIKNLEVMEFIESDDGKAIRIFQTVNDRGRPLSNMDKAKSLLIYYSNRLLDGKLDDEINNKFGEIFRYYNNIKEIGKHFEIETIARDNFTEDSIMRYHFLAYADDKYDYRASENYVLDEYLKKTLKGIKSNEDKLEQFISEYTTDLTTFFKSFLNILQKTKSDKKYYKIFSILGLSATLYPLLIRLETRNLLNQKINRISKLFFIDLIEITDVRVYKIYRGGATKDMSFLARDSKSFSKAEIKTALFNFIQNFVKDSEFKRRLQSNLYPNEALRYIFIEYDEKQLKNKFSLRELTKMNVNSRRNPQFPTIEHIFSQEARFDFPNFGFRDSDEYSDKIHTLGNLTLLEKELQGRATNLNPDEKVRRKFYDKSVFKVTTDLSAELKTRGLSFTADDINGRMDKLTKFCMKRWKI